MLRSHFDARHHVDEPMHFKHPRITHMIPDDRSPKLHDLFLANFFREIFAFPRIQHALQTFIIMLAVPQTCDRVAINKLISNNSNNYKTCMFAHANKEKQKIFYGEGNVHIK